MNGPAAHTALTIALPALPPEALTPEDAARLSSYVAAAVAEGVADFLTEKRVRATFDAAKAEGLGYDGALGECENRRVASTATAKRILEGKWRRQPENRPSVAA